MASKPSKKSGGKGSKGGVSKSNPTTPIASNEKQDNIGVPAPQVIEEVNNIEDNSKIDVNENKKKVPVEEIEVKTDTAVGASYIGKSVESLMTPALILDKERLKNNASTMLAKAQEYGVQLRPHMKTHKTIEGADLMTGGRRRCIAVSTLAEVKFYSDVGYDDILYTGYLDRAKIEVCAKFAETINSFHILLDSYYIVELLRDRVLKDDKKWSVFMDVDCGYHRSGVDPSEYNGVGLAVSLMSKANIFFCGLYIHCGNAYNCASVEEVAIVADDSAKKAKDFAQKLRYYYAVRKMKRHKVNFPHIALGSTPTCSQPVPSMKDEVTEWHPGNYIFYDVEQQSLGSCKAYDIAVQVLTRVIAHYPSRKQMLIDCGWTGLNLHGAEHGHGTVLGHPHLKIISMSQEVSIVEDDRGTLDQARYPIGTILRIYPYHACGTAALHPVYYVHSNDTIIEQWTPVRGW